MNTATTDRIDQLEQLVAQQAGQLDGWSYRWANLRWRVATTLIGVAIFLAVIQYL